MRAVVVVVWAACGTYDPLDDVAFREFPDTASAVRAIVAETGSPRVYAIGEYHPAQRMLERHSPLERFSYEILPVLDSATHLVVESWFDPSCAAGGDPVQSQIAAATNRPPSERADLALLIASSHLPTRGLPMTCIEHSSMLDPTGRVDFYRLLALVTAKLLETTLQLLDERSEDTVGGGPTGFASGGAAAGPRGIDEGHTVIVYGGALHNDLYPRWPLDELAYGHALARILDQRTEPARRPSVVEIDLVVPEIVEPIQSLRREAWFPLLARAGPDRALVWERGPASYVVILPSSGYAPP